ncbi:MULTISPECIES: hypothetical protein [unclassified Caulobacter]|uniref:hypothetical protein n=1 Tax=unclassified Caulobacter TaxID=2648921 RepID=UPI0011B22DA3|nr:MULTISPECIES: hypothetical protein [unclassified Caulobacter]
MDHKSVDLRVELLSAFIGNNAVSVTDLNELISNISSSLNGVVSTRFLRPDAAAKPSASQTRRNITPDAKIARLAVGS